MDAQEWLKRKLPNEMPSVDERPIRRSGRDVIFRRLFPGVLLFLIFYYVFAYRPELAEYLCGKPLHPSIHHQTPSKPTVEPVPVAWLNDQVV